MRSLEEHKLQELHAHCPKVDEKIIDYQKILLSLDAITAKPILTPVFIPFMKV